MITLLMTLIGDDPKEQERFEQFFYLYEQRAFQRAFNFMNEMLGVENIEKWRVSVLSRVGPTQKTTQNFK